LKESFAKLVERIAIKYLTSYPQMVMTQLVGFILLSYLMVQPIQACSCAPGADGPACQLISSRDVVFLGESMSITGDGLYRFHIERVYKGLKPNTREIFVAATFGSCSTSYPVGHRYLIFANTLKGDSKIVSSIMCSGSRSAEGNQDDIDFLDNYIQGKTKTAVFGKVLQWVTHIGLPREDESAPLEGATVLLVDSKNKFLATSQSDGSFDFSGIPPGDYQLSAKLEGYTADPLSYKVSVAKSCCDQVFIQLNAGCVIEGKLLTHEGKPAADTRMELLHKNQKGEWYSTYKMWKQTDANGNFRFENMQSGEYLLGHEAWGDSPSNYTPYPAYYYPGSTDRSQAQILTLAPKQILKDLNLTLPPPHKKRNITIKIVMSDGGPPGSNLLQIFSQNDLIRNLEGGEHKGVFVFEGYQEREYEFSARYWVDNLGGGGEVGEKLIARPDPVKLLPGKNNVEIKLILRHILKDKDDR
jgi:Carboxypeptidase regulatory-like domain